MHKLISLAAGAALAIAVSLSAAAPSRADAASDAAAAGLVGGVFGFMAGAAAASGDGPAFHHHRRHGNWMRHVRDCEDAYGWRYDPDTDLVTRRHTAFYCDL